MFKYLLAAALPFAATQPLGAESLPFDADQRVADDDLASMRGGFALPGGINVALTVEMDAAINGALILRTVFRADAGVPTLTVYAPAPGQTGTVWATPASRATTATAAVAPVMIFDHNAGVTQVQALSAVPATIAVSTVGNPVVGAAPDGLSPLPVAVGGPAVATAAGLVRLDAVPTGTRISLTGTDLTINQLVGQAFLNALQNTANGRHIDTATMVNIDLHAVLAAQAATATMRVQGLVSGVAAGLVR